MPQFDDFQVTWNVKVDLLVLRYMARKIAYFLPDAAAGTPLPRVHFAQEQRNRIHRIVIYRRGEHLLNGSLLFVGFISGVQEHVTPATVQEIHRVVHAVLRVDTAASRCSARWIGTERFRRTAYKILRLPGDRAAACYGGVALRDVASQRGRDKSRPYNRMDGERGRDKSRPYRSRTYRERGGRAR